MDKGTAKRQVAKVLAKQLNTHRNDVFADDDGDGKQISDADRQRLRNAYNELITFLQAKADGKHAAKW
jgi:hypothetical protein